MRQPAGTARRARSGVAAIEFAILFPVFLLFVLGTMEFARAMWIKLTLDFVVQSAARCGAVDTLTCGTVTQVQNYAANLARSTWSLPVTSANFHVTAPLPACGVQVSATYPFRFIDLVGGKLISNPIVLQATACFPR